MYLKWRQDFDCERKTDTWLNCNRVRRKQESYYPAEVQRLQEVSQARIMGRQNFSKRWITGANSIRTSNIRDHAHSDQHVHAMALLHREQAVAQARADNWDDWIESD